MKHIPCLAGDPQRLQHLMRREIAIMKRISYDRNIVQFYGACSGDDGAWVCMELMEARICLRFIKASRVLSQRASRTLWLKSTRIDLQWHKSASEGIGVGCRG